MPMTQRGAGTRFERSQIDVELIETRAVTQPLARATGDEAVMRRRVSRARIHRQVVDVDFGHGVTPVR